VKNVGANVVMNVVMNVVTNVVTASLQSQNKYYTEASLKWSNRKALFFGGHVLSKCPKERHAPPPIIVFQDGGLLEE
jgi:hypothetical protein